MLAPVLDGIAGEMAGRATFVKVDVDENGEAAQRYGVMSIPNVIVFKDGVPVGNNLGYVPGAYAEGVFGKTYLSGDKKRASLQGERRRFFCFNKATIY